MPANQIEPSESNETMASRRQMLAGGARIVVAGMAAGTLAMTVTSPTNAASHEEAVSDNEQIIRAFVAAWSNLDAEELAGYFTEDGTYLNMMLVPVTGRENLIAFIGGFLSNWSETNWEMVNIVSKGDLVVAERVDRTRIGDKHVDLPCVGMFEMENGKIKVWRDYFDLATYTTAFAE